MPRLIGRNVFHRGIKPLLQLQQSFHTVCHARCYEERNSAVPIFRAQLYSKKLACFGPLRARLAASSSGVGFR